MTRPDRTVPQPAASHRIGLTTRIAARAVGLAAAVLARQSPARIRTVLCLLRRGSRPARRGEVEAARGALLATSLRLRGREACLPRSLAIVLLCRARGTWPTWSVGVLAAPPFTAHAWVEVDGEPVGEPVDGTFYRRLVTVDPPADRPGAAHRAGPQG